MSRNLNPQGMSAVIGGRRYTVNTATEIANNDYWDGNNFTRSGRNTWLFRTRGGAFFSATRTLWQGERDSIQALTEEEARELYEMLPERSLSYEAAFGIVVEEAAAGRPPLYDATMRRALISLPDDMLDWLRGQPAGISGTVRDLIRDAMNR